MDWLALPPQSDEKRVLLVEGDDARVVGTTSERIREAEVRGRPALHRVQTLQSAELGSRRAETVVFRESFAPHSHLDDSGDERISIRYRGLEVTGERRQSDGTVTHLEATLETPVFDSHSLEMVLRLLPLESGYAAQVPVFHAGRGRQMTVEVRVLGRDPVTDRGRRIHSWRVRTDWGGVHQEYWISGRTRALVRQSSHLADGVRLEFVR